MHDLANVGLWPLRRAQLSPEREAIVEVESGRRFTYAAFEARVARAAQWTVGRAGPWLVGRGVRAGDRVALALPNVAPYLELHFAAARIGAVDIPLNTRLAPPEFAYILRDAAPVLTVTDDEVRPRLERAGGPGGLERLDDYEAAVAG